ncbi:N-6 DNA methylase [Hyphococcus lacteus]|uniref:site-specific DNA-methyltransferase (adenine-specific) n=1 Tax=Hyphococcus lacteus TaxID=3143536 RepID=A0ABV3Z4I3_9PROT
MARSGAKRSSERRAEHLLNDLLDTQGWDRRRPPIGDVLFQSEFRSHPQLELSLRGGSKTGKGYGIPEALIVDRSSRAPLAIIEAKADVADIELALKEAIHYASVFLKDGHHPLAIGLAGDNDEFELRVAKRKGERWVPVTYDKEPIGWIPNREDIHRISAPSQSAEIRPSVPAPEVLAMRADEINRLLRESSIKDELRPAAVAAIMLALWQAGIAGTEIRRDKASILKDINSACKEAFVRAGKASLANSIRVDQSNVKLAENARRIASILERLNVSVLTAEHDYLGQLYETFFRYTGGNTIGQYFTPRHVAQFMADVTDIGIDDVVLDPACGSGGFLIAAMDKMLRQHKMKRDEVVGVVAEHLIGFESEPVTAALSVANMILRGDGSTGIHQADAFTSTQFPKDEATVVLMNPPFPHKKTDTPAEDFVNRALDGLALKGRLAVILPTSILVKRATGAWRKSILKKNQLTAVCQLPDELFQPFASATTSVVLLEKGRAHDPKKKTMFVRLNHDGLVLRKSARVPRDSEPDQRADAIDAVLNRTEKPGFSGLASVSGDDEWAAGAYIESAAPDENEVREGVDVLLRRLASFYTRYAREVIQQREAIASGELRIDPYRDLLKGQRLKNAADLPRKKGTVGGAFEIFYGMKELHSRDGMVPGSALIISPTEGYNGCYGWLDFSQLIEPPFVTVAQTGSIGEAFVQLEPCAVNDDCLVLLPRDGVDETTLVLAAATLHAEKWRFSYGRKLTPQRIADFKLPKSKALIAWVANKVTITKQVISASLRPYLPVETAKSPKEVKKGRDSDPLSMEGVDPVEAIRAFMQVSPEAIAAREAADGEDDAEDIADAKAALAEPDGATWVDIKAARRL